MRAGWIAALVMASWSGLADRAFADGATVAAPPSSVAGVETAPSSVAALLCVDETEPECDPTRFEIESRLLVHHRTVVTARGPRSLCGTSGCPSKVYLVTPRAARPVLREWGLRFDSRRSHGVPCLLSVTRDRPSEERGEVQRDPRVCWDGHRFRGAGAECSDASGTVRCP